MPSARTSLTRQAANGNAVGSPSASSTPSREKEDGGRIIAGKAKAKAEDDVPALIIDLGSHSIRIANAKRHLLTCPNAIIRQRSSSSSSSSSELLVGPQIDWRCTSFGSLALRFPMERGFIIDWPAQKLILDVSLAEAMRIEHEISPASSSSSSSSSFAAMMGQQRLLEGRKVIVTESALNFAELQQSLDVVFLEEYGAGSLWRCCAPQLVRYALKPAAQCQLIVDVGHGATHVVPMLDDDVVWKAVRRQPISGRMLTNLFKETLSFRQWDMMDETWLVGHIKEQSCFLASSLGGPPTQSRRRKPHDQRPSDWSYADLVEMCQATKRANNPIVQEYVLPDYSRALPREDRLGHIARGPNARGRKRQVAEDWTEEDGFIAIRQDKEGQSDDRRDGVLGNRDLEEEEEEEEEDDSDEFHEGQEGDEATSARPKKRQKRDKASKRMQGEADDQLLILERERFQIPEVMFDPGMLGLALAPLHEVIEASIAACDEAMQGPLWSNIVLVGGGARMPGLKQRLEGELRMLAPAEYPVKIQTPEDPVLAATRGAQVLLSAATSSSLSRMLRTRMVNGQDWTPDVAKERFASWNTSSK